MVPFVTGLAIGAQLGHSVIAPTLEWFGKRWGLLTEEQCITIDRIVDIEKSILAMKAKKKEM